MNGNCSAATQDFDVDYPCLERDHSFGYAITGIVNGEGHPVVLNMSSYQEPNIRDGQPAVNLTGTVTCKKTDAGVKYAIYRFNKGNAGVPRYFHEYPRYAD